MYFLLNDVVLNLDLQLNAFAPASSAIFHSASSRRPRGDTQVTKVYLTLKAGIAPQAPRMKLAIRRSSCVLSRHRGHQWWRLNRIRQSHWRWSRNYSRYGRRRRRGCIRPEQHFHSAKVNGLASMKPRFGDSRSINEGSIRRSKILNNHMTAIDHNLAMRSGNRGIGNLEIVGKAPPDRVGARLQLDIPCCG